jgi:alpha-D-xyloside xylohydrolase
MALNRCAIMTAFAVLLVAGAALAVDNTSVPVVTPVAPGIWRVTLGTPEQHTPVSVLKPEMHKEALGKLPEAAQPPFGTEDIRFYTNPRGSVVILPMGAGDQIYGLGLHLTMFNCTNTRKEITVNDNQADEDGSSHAPVPFYVTSKGYGVYVDTARYARFYCGDLAPVGTEESKKADDSPPAASTAALYAPRDIPKKSMTVEVPVAKGVDVYIFAGPDMKAAVQRYNLFSGGGCMPPMWGLGMYYRGHTKFNAEEVLDLAKRLRDTHMPCDVFGLEPGWHTAAYSCSYVWSPERWPDPAGFINTMRGMGYQLNLWEHAFVHPTSPLHESLLPLSGNYEVWRGLVPDFSLDKTREIFGGYHDREFVKKGVGSFKLDECDNQPNKKDPWSFPELSAFPSGMDGEQMHCMFGTLYQKTLNDVFRANNLRTYGKVRASHALAAPLPFVLYSDHYTHKDFIRSIANCGFSGILWQPEVRNCDSIDDLMRRAETVIFAPQTVFDSWFLKLPPWMQIDTDKNNAGELLPNYQEIEAKIRDLVQWRMRLIPYLYAAFANYAQTGEPPFRALCLDWPQDKHVRDVDDEYMMGPSILVAPMTKEQTVRKVYLPEGDWYDFWTNAKYDGGKAHEITAGVDTIPVFVKSGCIIPLAEPVEHVTPETVFNLEVRVYGKRPADFTLIEDDGVNLAGPSNRVTLHHKSGTTGKVERKGDFKGERYKAREWKVVGE